MSAPVSQKVLSATLELIANHLKGGSAAEDGRLLLIAAIDDAMEMLEDWSSRNQDLRVFPHEVLIARGQKLDGTPMVGSTRACRHYARPSGQAIDPMCLNCGHPESEHANRTAAQTRQAMTQDDLDEGAKQQALRQTRERYMGKVISSDEVFSLGWKAALKWEREKIVE